LNHEATKSTKRPLSSICLISLGKVRNAVLRDNRFVSEEDVLAIVE